jgi:glycine hydroxymethyltransferase
MAKKGYRIVSGGTDNHLFLVDLRSKDITGKEMTVILEDVNITVNKNLIPYDPKSAMVTSGIRIGTPAMTTRAMKKEQMSKICDLIDETVKNRDDKDKLEEIRKEVKVLTDSFPLYKELD